MFDSPLQIGDLTLSNRVVLAPLAGVSDVPFRRVCQEQGAGLTYVEMLSAIAINRHSDRTLHMLARHESEDILGVQVTGPTPAEIAESVRFLDREGFETIDLNMGCPVRKVVRKGWGSAMLCDPQKVEDVTKACKDATDKPLTVKIRLGYTRPTMNVDEIAERISAAGADMLTIHGRCRSERYDIPVDHASIKIGFDHAAPGITTLANGDVMDIESAHAAMDRTGADGVMISRGALGNPWIFRHLIDGADNHPTVTEWLDLVLRHMDYHATFYGDSPSTAVRFRKHLLWYLSGFRGARKLRGELSTVPSLDVARESLRNFAAGFHPETRRFADRDRAKEKNKSQQPSATTEAARNRDATYDPKYDMDRESDRGVGDDEG